jgi:hypothetical protein
MKYCARCGAEYIDSVNECADCPGVSQFLTAEQMRDEGREVKTVGEDPRRFLLVTTVEDPLTAEQYAAVLGEAKIPVDVRAQQAGTVDIITDGVLPFWEIYVPEHALTKATRLIAEAHETIEASADEAAKAAEEEALSARP